MVSKKIIVTSKNELNENILSILNDMWKFQQPEFNTIIVKLDGREIVIAGLIGDNFMVNWENLIKAKQIFKQNKK